MWGTCENIVVTYSLAIGQLNLYIYIYTVNGKYRSTSQSGRKPAEKMVVKKKTSEIWWFHLPKYSSFKCLKQRYACWWYIQVPNRIPSCKLLYNGGWSPNSSFALKKNYSTNRFSQNAIVQISFLGDWLHQNPCKSRETLNITAKNGSIKNWKAIQNPIVRVVFTWQKSNDRCSITSKSSPNACDHHEFSSISSKFPYCLPSGDQTWLAGKSNVSKADFPAMFEILFYHYEIPDQKPMLP